jgi:hypothetical protein
VIPVKASKNASSGAHPALIWMRAAHRSEDTAMTGATQERSYTLARNAHVVLERLADAVVCCCSGSIWLTQYGDSRDIVLKAGDRFPIDRGAVIVIEAIAAANIVVRPAAAPVSPGGSWRRLLHRLLRRSLAPRWRSAANARFWMRNSPS